MNYWRLVAGAILTVGFCGLFLTDSLAGEINSNEQRVAAVINGSFEYNGITYVAKQEYISQAMDYMMRDDVDWTSADCDYVISEIYGNVKQGIDDGYITAVNAGQTVIEGNRKAQETSGTQAETSAAVDDTADQIKQMKDKIHSLELELIQAKTVAEEAQKIIDEDKRVEEQYQKKLENEQKQKEQQDKQAAEGNLVFLNKSSSFIYFLNLISAVMGILVGAIVWKYKLSDTRHYHTLRKGARICTCGAAVAAAVACIEEINICFTILYNYASINQFKLLNINADIYKSHIMRMFLMSVIILALLCFLLIKTSRKLHRGIRMVSYTVCMAAVLQLILSLGAWNAAILPMVRYGNVLLGVIGSCVGGCLYIVSQYLKRKGERG